MVGDTGRTLATFVPNNIHRYAPEGNERSQATSSHGLEVRSDFTKQIGKFIEAYRQGGKPVWNDVDTHAALCEMLDKVSKLPGIGSRDPRHDPGY